PPRTHYNLFPFPTRRSSDLHIISANMHVVRTSLMEILIYLIYGIVRDCLPILPKTRMMLTSLKVKESITTMYIQPLVLPPKTGRSEEHTSELQSRFDLVCRL